MKSGIVTFERCGSRSGPAAQSDSWKFISLMNSEVKGKGKIGPITDHEGPEEEQLYSSTLTSVSALDGGGWSTPRPGRFNPREDPVPIF